MPHGWNGQYRIMNFHFGRVFRLYIYCYYCNHYYLQFCPPCILYYTIRYQNLVSIHEIHCHPLQLSSLYKWVSSSRNEAPKQSKWGCWTSSMKSFLFDIWSKPGLLHYYRAKEYEFLHFELLRWEIYEVVVDPMTTGEKKKIGEESVKIGTATKLAVYHFGIIFGVLVSG